jgi:hypothetical protein
MRSSASLFNYLPGSSEIFNKFEGSVSHYARRGQRDRPLRSPNRRFMLRSFRCRFMVYRSCGYLTACRGRPFARSRGVALFDQTRSKSFIGKSMQASDRRRSFDRSASRHGRRTSARDRSSVHCRWQSSASTDLPNALETFHAACLMARGISQWPRGAYVMQRQNVAAD